MAKLLYGSETDLSRCVAFCRYHRKWLTLRQLKQKKCLSKRGYERCNALKIREEHPYWEERRRRRKGSENEEDTDTV